MKMALRDNTVFVKDMDNVQFSILKSWNLMRWDRSQQILHGPATGELLNKLAGLVRLPENIEAERQRLNGIQDAVDRERMNENPVPLYKPPVKLSLFKHQVRALNMCLLTFGLVDPPKREEES